jgi:hypothetical protein
VLQAVLVQLVTMSYEFVLLKAANCEAMKRFSVFLALPSATIRSMAARQLQVRGGAEACAQRWQQQPRRLTGWQLPTAANMHVCVTLNGACSLQKLAVMA